MFVKYKELLLKPQKKQKQKQKQETHEYQAHLKGEIFSQLYLECFFGCF